MPSAYTHDRFGKEVLERLPGKEKALIRAKSNLFHIGLQGPDLFFYYRPLRKNPVSGMGHVIHRQPGKTFMKRLAETAAAGNFREEDLSFIYGNICHFILDRECHGNVFRWEEISGISHAEIEGEMDRALMLRYGEDPLRTMPAAHIHPDRKAAAVLHAFYPELTEKKLFSVIRSFRGFNEFLTMPERWKRKIVFALMKRIGVYESLHGHFINEEENPACAPNREALLSLYDRAVPKAADLIVRFRDMAEGREEWSPLYDMNYEADYTP